MTIRLPKPDSAARILREALKEHGATLGHAQALDVIARLYGHDSWYAMQRAGASEEPGSTQTLGTRIVKLTDSLLKKGCEFQARNVVLIITGNDTTVDITAYPAGRPKSEPLGGVTIEYAEAAKDLRQPDPTLPFYGCALPNVIRAVEFVSQDPQSSGTRIISAEHGSGDGYIEWLEQGMLTTDYDLSEEVIRYGEPPDSISGEDLIEAKLSRDGCFTLKDGRELYLIDELGKRWAPQKRV